MWLGVVLHGIIPYQTTPRPGWPTDSETSIYTDILYGYLHSFRMPLFFLIAGFFANFLLKRIGTRHFLEHRVKRILLPFVLSLIVIVPASNYVFAINRLYFTPSIGNIFIAAFNQSLNWTGFYHLWFLYYLMIMYILLVITRQYTKLPIFVTQNFTEAKYLASSVILVAVQFFFFDGHIEPWTGIIPKAGQLLYYSYFFVIGYLIFNNQHFLFKNVVLRFLYLPIGLLLVILTKAYGEILPYWIFSITVSLQSILLVLGNIAVFINIFTRESKALRYLSDASYWFYLIHLPVVVALQLLLLEVEVSLWIKIILVITVTTTLSIISYQYFVRYTWAGVLLNGKKKKKPSSFKPKLTI